MIYLYARVSTDGQSVDAQVRQLRAAGCEKIFRAVAGGAKTDRAELRKVLARRDAGDVLKVARLDRLARSTRDLLNTLGTPSNGEAPGRHTTPLSRVPAPRIEGLSQSRSTLSGNTQSASAAASATASAPV